MVDAQNVALRDFQNFGIWSIYKLQIQLFIVATYIFFFKMAATSGLAVL
jgi:hypothetical protein